MIINIVGGSGLMGKIHRKVFENFGHEVIISGRNSERSIEEAARMSDITIVSVPIEATEETIKKVAPYCKAIMDFTSVKGKPVETMLKYSNQDCEVLGLHPLYGYVDHIKGRTIIYCKTERTGSKCNEVIECLKKAGAKLIEMSVDEHDKKVLSLGQILRFRVIEAYGKTAHDFGLSIEDMYSLSPPPTKLLIEILSRQLDDKNDSMYEEMIRSDRFLQEVETKFIENLKLTKKSYRNISSDMKNKISKEFLKDLQEKAKKKIN